MYTECPECGIAFRVTAKVLQQAKGNVRCGGCNHAFNALDFLSEDMPGTPGNDVSDVSHDDLAETSRRLLQTLDELAGPDAVQIEDTGVEWRVLEDNLDIDQGAAGAKDDELRFDDNTPLPDDFDEEDDAADAPPVAAEPADADDADDLDDATAETGVHVAFSESQDNEALTEADEWTDLLEEVREPDSLEPEEELVAVHDQPPPGDATEGNDDALDDLESQLQTQAEALGLNVTSTAKSIRDEELGEAGEPTIAEIEGGAADVEDEDIATHVVDGFSNDPDHADVLDDVIDGPSADLDETFDDDEQDEAILDDEDISSLLDDSEDETAAENAEESLDALNVTDGAQDEDTDAPKSWEDADELGDATDDFDDLRDAVDEFDDSLEASNDGDDESLQATEDALDVADSLQAANDADDVDAAPEMPGNGADEDEPLQELGDANDVLEASNDQIDADDDGEVDGAKHVVPPPTEEEMTVNMEIDQEMMALAMQDDEFSATLVGIAAADKLFDENPRDVETIIMEGETIRNVVEQERRAAEIAARSQLDDPSKLATAYLPNRDEIRGGRREYDPPSYGLIAVIVVLGLILVGQFIHNSRETLATTGWFKSTVAPIYNLLGSPVTPLWDIKGWQFETTNGSIGDAQKSLIIVSRLVNRSDQELPYPLVHVSLTDRWEEIMGSRILEPDEYLAGALNPDTLVPPGENFTAVVTIENPALESTGFKLNVCYRNGPESVRCAIEDFKN